MNIKEILKNLFPFHFIFDETFTILSIGRSAKKLFPSAHKHDNLLSHFEIQRPKIEMSFHGFAENQNILFIAKNIHDHNLEIKGQALQISESTILFVFTPIVRDVSFFKELKMNMDDFAIYDSSLELMFALQATQKSLNEANDMRIQLEEKVKERTYALKMKTDEILAQNEEYLQQQDQLNKQSIFLEEKNRKLQRARELTHKKNKELKLHSTNLKKEVDERTLDLININSELLNQNNQLEQFAFIVAHNLRAPIARILGLVNIIKMEGLINKDNEFYIDNINASTLRLEEIIKDLNIILEIRKGLHHAYENISIPEKVNKVLDMLASQIEESHAEIQSDYKTNELIYSISSYIENILYNLLSNALKYRDPERQLKIQITTEKTSDNVICLTVKDNGIGFDLEKNKDNLYKLYKRFHSHVEGKGIGLYLVKTQLDVLGAKIVVSSKKESGTKFSVYYNLTDHYQVK